jgi:UDP-N-acetyl-D-mannosaminuronic acid dehydrogenase
MRKNMKKISIVGLGYIGLPTALIVANKNLQVFGFDIDKEKIKKIKDGISTISEPGAQELLSQAISQKKLVVSNKLKSADCFIITVPTPFKAMPCAKEKNQADLSYVFQAATEISKKIKPGNLVILESTVPVGTTKNVTKLIQSQSKLKAGIEFFIAYCPERVLPGKIFSELIYNDRIIGGMCEKSTDRAKNFYKLFVKGTCHTTDAATAEMIKLVENSSRDVQIAFSNQVAQMCETRNIDPFEVIELANKHPRINLLLPGCGVGGHCIAVDPWFLIEKFPKSTTLLRESRKINNKKPYIVIKNILKAAKNFVKKYKKQPHVLVLGLTFKPDVGDIRQSPALFISKVLSKWGKLFHMKVHEPMISKEFIKEAGLTAVENINLAVKKADIIVSLVKHKQFRKIDQKNILHKIIIDPCHLFCTKRGTKNEAAFLNKRESKRTLCSKAAN